MHDPLTGAITPEQFRRVPIERLLHDGRGVLQVGHTDTIRSPGRTRELKLLHRLAGALARLEGNEPIVDFRWSPDGSRLVTSRGRHPNDMVIIKRVR